jgi:hypothetical protein
VPEEETKITMDQGIGVLDFTALVNRMLTDTFNYVIITVRNNAEGSSAKNIRVSLENVDPFYIYECNEAHNPSDNRATVCNQFFDDFGIPYKGHKINEMLPNEEIQFFWNIQAPSDSKIVGMKYDHTIYYILEYNYTSTVTQTLAAISQQEFLERSQEGPVSLAGQTLSSPGEIKLQSRTQQPLIFIEASPEPFDFTLDFRVQNVGRGVVKPGTSVLIAIRKDALTEVNTDKAEEFGWKQYGEDDDLDERFDETFNLIEYPELSQAVREDLMLLEIEGNILSLEGYSITLPITFDTSNIFEPEKILTMTAYISYRYLKEGSTSLSVYPTD